MLGSVTVTTESYVFAVTFLCASVYNGVADISLDSNNSGVVFILAWIQYLVCVSIRGMRQSFRAFASELLVLKTRHSFVRSDKFS